jgi:HSP20 family protein
MPLRGIARSLDWPRLELGESDREIRITAELPELEEKDVEILVEDGMLTIRGDKRSQTEGSERGYSERSDGRFERRVGLPRGVEPDKANAAFASGVLTITLPKSAEAIGSVRRIAINGEIRH